jgi:hypothetical protein
MPSNLQAWQRHLQQMKACKSIADLVRQHGEPSHKVPQDGFEIWHYPLGVAGGTLYSIHVSVWPDQRSQIYMHMEPTSAPDTPAQRPSFGESVSRAASRTLKSIGRLLRG